MIHTGKSLDDQLSSRKLTMILARLDRSDDTWFNGTVGAVDRRLSQVDNALRFARGVTARIGSTEAGHRCADALPRLEQHRHELVALRDGLLNGLSGPRGDAARTGRRVANNSASTPTAGFRRTASRDFADELMF